jgi:WD40 repeat protein
MRLAHRWLDWRRGGWFTWLGAADESRRHQLARRITRWLALMALVMSLALAGCGAQSRMTGGTQPMPVSPTATPYAMLPLFSDWRIAYLTDAGTLHAYALDGTSDLAGPRLGFITGTPTLSPDGRTLAYITGTKTGKLMLVRLGSRTAATAVFAETLFTFAVQAANWSPDSRWLAVSALRNGALAIYLVDTQSGAITQVPGTLWAGVSIGGGGATIFGWMDTTQLVIANAMGTQLIEVTTGAATNLALPDGHQIARLSPDGRRALLYTAGCGANPDLMLLDLASGAARHLPTISQATSGTPPTVWQPGTALALGMLAPTPTQPAMMARFDLDADTFTPLPVPPGLVPSAWLPDGQTLLLAQYDSTSSQFNYFLEDLTVPGVQPKALPASVTHIFGFVRTGDAPAQGYRAPAFAAAVLNMSFAGVRGSAHDTRWLEGMASC